MGRIARNKLLYDGCYAHVFSRSIEKRKIFCDTSDFEAFMKLLKKTKIVFDFQIYHYCLMPTHFHLAVRIGHVEKFSAALHALKCQYTQKFNNRYDRQGPLWKERFKSLLIENERYLHACGLYIENNPVKAGLTESHEEWQYSSAWHHSGLDGSDFVDGYEQQELPQDLDINDEVIFTRGAGIGSDFFKMNLREEICNNSDIF